jgi:hypothetical protein
MAHIYKEKYFTNGNFLDSNVGGKPSYAWQSMWKARTFLKEGLVWREGDGNGIKIWKDRWLNSPFTYSIQSPVKVLGEEASVSEHIDEDSKWWNFNLIKESFLEEEVGKICDFTVHSAYHKAKENSIMDEASSSNSMQMAYLWKKNMEN